MSENNGILYVFERVSVSQRAQMESDGRSPLWRRTQTPKWEGGDHEAVRAADPRSDRAGAHCHPTSRSGTTSVLSLWGFVCLIMHRAKETQDHRVLHSYKR